MHGDVMSHATLVLEPYAAIPTLTWVDAAGGVSDRRLALQPREMALDAAVWLVHAEVICARQGRRPDAVAVVSWAWPDLPSDAAALAHDRALLAHVCAALALPGKLVDEGGARALGETRFGVGAGLGDQVHIGVGVRAAGLQLRGRWHQQDDGRPWSADGLVVDPTGPAHGGHGWLRDWTWPESLVAAAALLGHRRPTEDTSLDGSAALQPWLDGLQRLSPLADDVAVQVGEALGVALGGVMNVLDLPDVVLHVAPAVLRPRVQAIATATLARHSFASLRQGHRWHRPTLGVDAVALGAAQYPVA